MTTRRLMIALGMSLCLATVLIVSVHGAAGRWKLGPDGCYFDANDDGPNQCTRGRWRVDSYGGCYFDALDSGPDQCAPSRAGSLITDPASKLDARTASAQTRVATAQPVRDTRSRQSGRSQDRAAPPHG